MNFKFPSKLLLKLHPASEWKVMKIIDTLRNESEVALHIGCADHLIPNMINCDKLDDNADLKIDTLNLDKFEDSSVDYIEHNHMMEHIPLQDVERAFKEWSRVIKPGGYITITCPNIDHVARLWLKYKNKKVNKKNEFRTRDYVMKMIYGNQINPGMYHFSGYNEKILSEYLEASGFSVEFCHTPFPTGRFTPSVIIVGKKK